MNNSFRRVRAGALIGALGLSSTLLTACSDSSTTADPTPPSSATPTSPSVSTSAPTESTEPTEPASSKPPAERTAATTSNAADAGNSCTELPARTQLIAWEVLRVSTPITVTSLEPQGTGVKVTGTLLSPAPVKVPTTTGAWQGTAPPKRTQKYLGWADRKPLTDRVIEPGRYYWYARATVTTPARVDSVDLTYTREDTGAEETISSRFDEIARASCS
ncbi:hypothetical protein [Nocardioides acrostichi]|uniref:Ig-like domain-containing protein n=1 Tax=Nocardioides acrostichi TaxID=2784339 RepID=A0A930UX88_9ACTN|nr:hypothetical protein [Nocardioides acrostichi]MBF4161801.1 hypothetical protein [Nocardioides acrostichi]